MSNDDWMSVSRTLDFIMSQKESPGVTGVAGVPELPKKKVKKPKVEQPVEQMRMF